MPKKSNNTITVIGTGYVGLVSGACFAELGKEVVCFDKDGEKIARLQRGLVDIYEPGLSEMVRKNLKEGRLSFSGYLGEAVSRSRVLFICVGTPLAKGGEVNLSYLKDVAAQLGKNMKEPKVIVIKSTVPMGVGTNVLSEIISRHWGGAFEIASNPEFLREGSGVADFLRPDRIVIGANSPRTARALLDLYGGIDCPKLVTSVESAEMIKYASNVFLAAKISFINEIANICEKANADIEDVALGIGLDKRIGQHYLKAGFGYGGSCLPKDIKSFYQLVRATGYNFKLLKSVIEVNNEQRRRILEKIKNLYPAGQLQKKTVAILGLAFKDNTDDVRESMAIDVAKKLHKLGARLRVYDPKAMENAKKALPKNAEFCDSASKAAQGADLVLIGAEWEQFKRLRWSKLKKLMKKPVIVDGRNLLDPAKMQKLGFRYMGVGRNA